MNNESDTFSRSGLQSDTGSSLPFAATMSGSSSPFVKSTDMSRPPFSDMSSLTRVLLLVVIYSGAIVVAHWLAYLIRFEFHPPIDQQTLF